MSRSNGRWDARWYPSKAVKRWPALLRRPPRCGYCGRWAWELDSGLTADHKTPKAAGGSDKIKNIVLACKPCNQRKAARSVGQFVR